MTRYERGHKLEVFTIRRDEWKVAIDGEVLPIEWNSKGAADAGATVELQRRYPEVL